MATKQVTANGDKVNWTLRVCNTSLVATCYNVQVALIIPTGLILSGPSNVGSSIIKVNTGVFNSTSKKWIIGDLAPGACVETNFEITANDISKAVNNAFTVTANLTSSCEEIIISDNSAILAVQTVPSCATVSLSIIGGGTNFNLAVDGCPSSSGTPSSSVVPFSSAVPSSSNAMSSSIPASSSVPPSSSVGQSSSNNGSSSAEASSSTVASSSTAP